METTKKIRKTAMSIPFRAAFIVCLLIYLATEAIISLNRPLIADRWVSESIQVTENGKRHNIDAVLEMDFFSKGFLTDMQFRKNGYASRYQIDGKDRDIGRLLGFPEASYTDNEDGVRLLKDGYCEVKNFKRSPGNNGDIVIFSEKGCPNFMASHMVGDRLQFYTEKDGREMKVILERHSRLNPLARLITVWNRHNYLGNAEEFMRNEPI